MTANHPVGDPRHTFLKPQEVIARYRWGRTPGYLELKKPGFPRPIGGTYRLDTLIDWEDRCLAGDVPDKDATAVTIPLAELVTAQVPSDPVTTPTAGLDAGVAVQEFGRGQTISNLVVVKLVGGKIQVKVSAGSARVLMDVSG